MPANSTITAFYSFTPNTKARASEVNTNFDVFRGNIIPISPNTVAAVHDFYALGSSEYHWQSLWVKLVECNTTTGIEVRIQGNPVSQFTDQGLIGSGIADDSIPLIAHSDKRDKAVSTTVGVGEIGFMGSILNTGVSVGSGTVLVAGTTMTIVSNGRPIALNMRGSIDVFYQTTGLLNAAPSVILRYNFTNMSQVGSGTIDRTVGFRPGDFTTTAFSGGRNQSITFDIGAMMAFIPFAIGLTGTWMVWASIIVSGTYTSASFSVNTDLFEL